MKKHRANRNTIRITTLLGLVALLTSQCAYAESYGALGMLVLWLLLGGTLAWCGITYLFYRSTKAWSPEKRFLISLLVLFFPIIELAAEILVKWINSNNDSSRPIYQEEAAKAEPRQPPDGSDLGLVASWQCTKKKKRPVRDLPDVEPARAFTCAHEKDVIPPRDPEADQLYVHAHWLRRKSLHNEDPSVYRQVERLIRIATAYGHDKANLELRQMISRGQARSPDALKEILDITEDLVDRGIPGSYYDMGRHLDYGCGVEKDPDLALKYYRKAADLGNPEAQYTVGDWMTRVRNQTVWKVGLQMYRCAAEQGHGDAAWSLGSKFQLDSLYPESLQAYQLGAREGSTLAALELQQGFNAPTDYVGYLPVDKDEERTKRYDSIRRFLDTYSYLNPKVPEIDSIVPLPPAKLPAWDGSFQWLKAHKANVPPPLPSEERINEMAKAKGLDPATGRPLPKPHAEAPAPEPVKVAAPSTHLGTTLASGLPCPQSGYWQCAATPALGDARRFIPAGMALPTVVVRCPERSFFQKLKNEPENHLTETTWTLVAYPDTRERT